MKIWKPNMSRDGKIDAIYIMVLILFICKGIELIGVALRGLK